MAGRGADVPRVGSVLLASWASAEPPKSAASTGHFCCGATWPAPTSVTGVRNGAGEPEACQ